MAYNHDTHICVYIYTHIRICIYNMIMLFEY